jgi:hypothetical protein
MNHRTWIKSNQRWRILHAWRFGRSHEIGWPLIRYGVAYDEIVINMWARFSRQDIHSSRLPLQSLHLYQGRHVQKITQLQPNSLLTASRPCKLLLRIVIIPSYYWPIDYLQTIIFRYYGANSHLSLSLSLSLFHCGLEDLKIPQQLKDDPRLFRMKTGRLLQSSLLLTTSKTKNPNLEIHCVMLRCYCSLTNSEFSLLDTA